MIDPPWMPRTEEEYRQQLAEDAGPQPDEMVRLLQALDAAEEEIERLQGGLKIATTAFHVIEQDLGKLIGLTRTEQKIATTIKLARKAMEDDPLATLPCGLDDGSTVCVLPKGHPIPHQSADGRRFLYPEG